MSCNFIIKSDKGEVMKFVAPCWEAEHDEHSPTVIEHVRKLGPGNYSVYVQNGSSYDHVMDVVNTEDVQS